MRLLTATEIVRELRLRKYRDGDPVKAIARDVGVEGRVIWGLLAGRREPNDELRGKLTAYLAVPYTPRPSRTEKGRASLQGHLYARWRLPEGYPKMTYAGTWDDEYRLSRQKVWRIAYNAMRRYIDLPTPKPLCRQWRMNYNGLACPAWCELGVASIRRAERPSTPGNQTRRVQNVDACASSGAQAG